MIMEQSFIIRFDSVFFLNFHMIIQVYLLQGGGIGVPGMQIALSALQAHNLIPTSNSSDLGTSNLKTNYF